MPSFSSVSGKSMTDFFSSPQGMIGLSFARASTEFTSLGCIAEQNGLIGAKLHLFSIAIELAFKSLALRSGATVSQCKAANHTISKMITLTESFGISIPALIKRKLSDDKSFRDRLNGTRYPVFSSKEIITYHKNYPEMIAEILEIPCPRPLTFKGGSALAEIRQQVIALKQTPN
jgi:hypothetical protein